MSCENADSPASGKVDVKKTKPDESSDDDDDADDSDDESLDNSSGDASSDDSSVVKVKIPIGDDSKSKKTSLMNEKETEAFLSEFLTRDTKKSKEIPKFVNEVKTETEEDDDDLEELKDLTELEELALEEVIEETIMAQEEEEAAAAAKDLKKETGGKEEKKVDKESDEDEDDDESNDSDDSDDSNDSSETQKLEGVNHLSVDPNNMEGSYSLEVQPNLAKDVEISPLKSGSLPKNDIEETETEEDDDDDEEEEDDKEPNLAGDIPWLPFNSPKKAQKPIIKDEVEPKIVPKKVSFTESEPKKQITKPQPTKPAPVIETKIKAPPKIVDDIKENPMNGGFLNKLMNIFKFVG